MGAGVGWGEQERMCQGRAVGARKPLRQVVWGAEVATRAAAVAGAPKRLREGDGKRAARRHLAFRSSAFPP